MEIYVKTYSRFKNVISFLMTLRHIINQDGLGSKPEKTDAIANISRSTNYF